MGRANVRALWCKILCALRYWARVGTCAADAKGERRLRSLMLMPGDRRRAMWHSACRSHGWGRLRRGRLKACPVSTSASGSGSLKCP